MREDITAFMGCTRQLIPLSNVQMDLDPWYAAPTGLGRLGDERDLLANDPGGWLAQS